MDAPNANPHGFLSQRARFYLYSVVATLAILASIASIGNAFALDDLALVAGNSRAHSLDHWWGLFALPYWPAQYGASLYRPVVTLGYALQWTVGHGAPWLFHAVSIVLYAAVCVGVAALLLEIGGWSVAAGAAALFAVHPVHVEAVANVVGQSELLAALATVGACIVFARARRRETLSAGAIGSIAALYAVACLCKEHALLLPALLLAVEWLAPGESGAPVPTFGERWRSLAVLFTALAVVGVAYLLVRTAVVGELLGEKHLVPVYGIRRMWVLLAVAPQWVRLLAWPAHLSADYSPQQIAIPDGPGAGVLVGALLIVAVATAYVALGSGTGETRRERGTARLGLAWLAITLLPVSNLFSVMLVAERTLLLPSVGAVLIAGAVVSMAWHRLAATTAAHEGRLALVLLTGLLVALGLTRSVTRQRVWRDNETLFAQTVLDAPLSYRAQFFYGQMLFQQGKRAEGERRLRQAIALNPTPSDVSPLNYLATEYRDAGLCPQALPLYERALANDGSRPDVRYGMASCLFSVGRIEEGRRLAEDGVRRGDLRSLFQGLLAQTGAR